MNRAMSREWLWLSTLALSTLALVTLTSFTTAVQAQQEALPLTSSRVIGRGEMSSELLLAVASALAPIFADPALRLELTTFKFEMGKARRTFWRGELRGKGGDWEIDIFCAPATPADLQQNVKPIVWASFGWKRGEGSTESSTERMTGGEVWVRVLPAPNPTTNPAAMDPRAHCYAFGGMFVAPDALRSCAYWNALPALTPSTTAGTLSTLDLRAGISAVRTREVGEIAMYEPSLANPGKTLEWSRSTHAGLRTVMTAWNVGDDVFTAKAQECAAVALRDNGAHTSFVLEKYVRGTYAWSLPMHIDDARVGDALGHALTDAPPRCKELMSRALSTVLRTDETVSAESVQRALDALPEELRSLAVRPALEFDSDGMAETLRLAISFRAALLENPLDTTQRRARGVETAKQLVDAVLKSAFSSRKSLCNATGWTDLQMTQHLAAIASPVTTRIGCAFPSLLDEIDPALLASEFPRVCTHGFFTQLAVELNRVRARGREMGADPAHIESVWYDECLYVQLQVNSAFRDQARKLLKQADNQAPILVAIREWNGALKDPHLIGTGTFALFTPHLTVEAVAPCVMPAALAAQLPE
ncbi:MAG: hypothetical protein DWI10_05415 [Planctomycetota bacterium]|nr:MAG: hypothetical protein DWI10_05415 [Planctomycetota bacterium]